MKLLNSAMMPQAGTYNLVNIDEGQFIRLIREYNPESYIGYPQTAAHIEQLTGITTPVNRDKTVLDDMDEMVIIRLKHRVPDPSKKGEEVPPDFEYFYASYSKERAVPGGRLSDRQPAGNVIAGSMGQPAGKSKRTVKMALKKIRVTYAHLSPEDKREVLHMVISNRLIDPDSVGWLNHIDYDICIYRGADGDYTVEKRLKV